MLFKKVLGKISKNRPEKSFQNKIIEYALVRGWKVAHFPKRRILRKDGSYYYATSTIPSGKGFPDLVLAKRGKVLFVEVKSAKGSPTVEQVDWLNHLPNSFVVYPKDFEEFRKLL